MADKQTGELTAAGTLDGTELLHVVKGGNSRRTTAAAIAALGGGGGGGGGSGGSPAWKGARVSLTSNFAVAHAANTNITWNSEERDTNSFYSGAAPTKLIIPAGVTKVRLKGSVDWTSNSTGRRYLWIGKNIGGSGGADGSDYSGVGFIIQQSTFETTQQVETDVLDVVAGDFFELRCRQDSGVSLNVSLGSKSWFAIEVVEGAVLGGGNALIEEYVASGSDASVTFSSLGSYRNLRIEMLIRGTVAATNAALTMRFNGDTAANYDSTLQVLSGGTDTHTNTAAGTSANLGGLPAATAPSGEFGEVTVELLEYRSTTFRKKAKVSGSYKGNDTGSQFVSFVGTDTWRSTAAITSVTIALGSGNIAAGSIIRVYGVP